jgi:dienelactone hydrolase
MTHQRRHGVAISSKFVFALVVLLMANVSIAGEPYDKPDRGQPGDAMIQGYLARAASEMEEGFLRGATSGEIWSRRRPNYRQDYLYMLGLHPLPKRTQLRATTTGTLEGEGFVVEMLHYQSVPNLYVSANLYRPSRNVEGLRLPAVLYVCGHSGMGRNGNKTAFQSHGIWLARHGYICLVVDSLQLGEIAALHHGTYREGRWWWHSRGYTPAGVECWNAVRGIDLLVERSDVDPARIAVTGISGGGAATFWVAAADERVKVAVPVSGMADLTSYVNNRVINGHCDCMFLYNTFQWPWTRIAGMVTPRPMLVINSDQDRIFPMDANERVIGRLERLYSLFGAGDRVDAVVSIGGHDYRQDIRQAAFRFLNTHLKNDPQPIEDSEVDLVVGAGPENLACPIVPERLRVFPTDADIPTDQKNTAIDQTFVPLARVELPENGEFDGWKKRLRDELKRVAFHHFPERIPPARPAESSNNGHLRLVTEGEITVALRRIAGPESDDRAKRVLLVVSANHSTETVRGWLTNARREGDAIYVCQPRGIGPTRWTRKDPPNYVERAHALLGRTVDSGRVWDVAATARYLRAKVPAEIPIIAAGEGAAGIVGAYSALLEPDIAGVTLVAPPASHMDASAPVLLNVLRVLDIPEALGMLAPRPLSLVGADAALRERVAALYTQAKAVDRLEQGSMKP